ncbi:heavy metal-(Cd/Co/Hg/Pb/Zn)-translocating P-type ATPase [Actinomycetospora succinea]|uniref:Heavy metal-(Cd/Co/Hg/Pb/Zn)-translocating P-type ATPase n=1 Tax=Actinomycetospora succinea TaxID=663603 RepID=A0A4R6VRD1_9PSEU|nr:heavy metal translocating P-type ATPase [Actinomycetospora succinea]TDQ65116.1 heavy metal-(Cd/Co/Hg/Pb/Zn)-translocating P-type ATPase [Actinomycetospora succinea]
MVIGSWWRSVVRLSEARWALASLAFFAVAALAQVIDAPAWLWGPLYAACYLSGGWEPALSGLRALRERTLDVDLLMIVAAVGAAAIGQVLDGGLLIVIFATSGALEAWATERTESSVRGLLELAPERACRVLPSGEEVVDVADLRVGDEVLVRPGETISADGAVVDGAGEVDQASITGEPLPVAKAAGDEVYAGTINGTGALRVRVGREAGESVVARIAVLVEQASATKARTQRFVETIEQRYSVGVVVATVAIFAIPLWFGEDLQGALLRAMTFMIVASPCAVVLATMPPLLAAIATAGRHGVLVKSARVMEDLAGVDAVALDKTGTLTEGRPELASVRGDEAVLGVAAAAERPSEHPLARAVVAAARARGLRVPDDVTDFAAEPGRGVRAVVEGRVVRVGSPALLGDDGVRGLVDDVEAEGHTAVVVLVDDRPRAVLALTDALRPGARAAVADLAARTTDAPVLLTGDNPRTASRTGEAVGIADRRAELLPADKVAAIEDRQAAGRRVMTVGDGINDAPALAAAHVGVAMGRAGADLTLQAADVVVVRDDLATLPALIDLARRARRVVVANLVIAGTIITGLVVWDLAGTLPLPLGVAGHEGSTVLVGLNGLRLLWSGAWSPRSAPAAHTDQPVGAAT